MRLDLAYCFCSAMTNLASWISEPFSAEEMDLLVCSVKAHKQTIEATGIHQIFFIPLLLFFWSVAQLLVTQHARWPWKWQLCRLTVALALCCAILSGWCKIGPLKWKHYFSGMTHLQERITIDFNFVSSGMLGLAWCLPQLAQKDWKNGETVGVC